MAVGDTYYEDAHGHHYVCVIWVDTPEELVIHKTDVYTGEVRVDRFTPNPNDDKHHVHEFNDNVVYGAHFEDTSDKDKKTMGKFDPRNKKK